MIPLKFDRNLFIAIYFVFIGFTVIGTLSHEFGHYIVGTFLGYQPKIHYGFTSFGKSDLHNEVVSIYQSNKIAIKAKKYFSKQERFAILLKKRDNHYLWTTLGGPVQTMVTGTIGVLWLFFRLKKAKISTIFDWFLLFLSLFWLRQSANLVSWLVGKSFSQIKGTGDEIKLAYFWSFPQGSIILVTGLTGLLISNYMILKFVPQDKISTFYLSGILGGISGYIIWFRILGPYVLP